MNTYGEQYNLLVLYPEQTSSGNMNKASSKKRIGDFLENFSVGIGLSHLTKKEVVENLRCLLEWSKPLLPSTLQILQEVIARDFSNGNKSLLVYVAGLSAGAAMSVIMGATYEVFVIL